MLDMSVAGGNWRTLRKYAEIWDIDTDHFDQRAAIAKARRGTVAPIADLLVEHSTYSRSSLKRRLYAEGLKERICEMCGQEDTWQGRPMSLILDHINGIRDDNRLENLRIVCPNCAATLETHCGRQNRIVREEKPCIRCETPFVGERIEQRYCSRACGARWDRSEVLTGRPKPDKRKVERPPREQLLAELEATNYSAVGRKYGVTDNAVRKWVAFYERQVDGDNGQRSSETEAA